MLAAKPDNLNSIPGSYRAGENSLPQLVIWPPCVPCFAHTINKQLSTNTFTYSYIRGCARAHTHTPVHSNTAKSGPDAGDLYCHADHGKG